MFHLCQKKLDYLGKGRRKDWEKEREKKREREIVPGRSKSIYAIEKKEKPKKLNNKETERGVKKNDKR